VAQAPPLSWHQLVGASAVGLLRRRRVTWRREGCAYAGWTQGTALQTAKPPNREGRRLCADYRTGLGGELQPCVPLMRRKGTKAPGPTRKA